MGLTYSQSREDGDGGYQLTEYDYILAILIYLLKAMHVMINIYGFLAKKYNACLDT